MRTHSKLAVVVIWAAAALPPVILLHSAFKFTDSETGWFVGITLVLSVVASMVGSARSNVMAFVFMPVLLGVLSTGIALGMLEYRNLKVGELEKHLSEYTAITPVAPASPDAPIALRRKMVAIDKDANQVDSVQMRLPSEIAAVNPADVKTVLWMHWENIEVGQYGSQGTAYRVQCTVRMIDLANPPVEVGTKVFEGSEPPSSSTSSAYGSTPFDDIISYLKSVSQ